MYEIITRSAANHNFDAHHNRAAHCSAYFILRELGYSWNLQKMCWSACECGRVASLLRPRPFLEKLSNALVSRKFCEQHTDTVLLENVYSPHAHTEHTGQELKHTLSVRVRE